MVLYRIVSSPAHLHFCFIFPLREEPITNPDERIPDFEENSKRSLLVHTATSQRASLAVSQKRKGKKNRNIVVCGPKQNLDFKKKGKTRK